MDNANTKHYQRGFTIIEVALVLAIGALIFLVVFLAVPALQRNQRNDARKRDQSIVAAAVAQFTSTYPNEWISNTVFPGTNVVDWKTGKGCVEGMSNCFGGYKIGQFIDAVSPNTYVKVMRADGMGLSKNVEYDFEDFRDLYRVDENTPQIKIIQGAQCVGTTKFKIGGFRSHMLVVVGLETVDDIVPYCMNVS
ncbi:MAG: type II secretion system protein [Candidatus Saccharibacteria bacterium]|nr:type II secretion system protein [Candidatus Saccharibacteria bacterium]